MCSTGCLIAEGEWGLHCVNKFTLQDADPPGSGEMAVV